MDGERAQSGNHWPGGIDGENTNALLTNPVFNGGMREKLTTDTLHHLRFVQEIARHAPIAHILEETTGSRPFDTAHPFEADREDYERALWFPDGRPSCRTRRRSAGSPRLNEPAAVEKLAGLAPDLTVVFGTRAVGRGDRGGRPLALNLHGGERKPIADWIPTCGRSITATSPS